MPVATTSLAAVRSKAADALASAAASALALSLLVLQPVLFYWRILINPSAHIPFDIEGFHLPLIAYVAQCVRNGIAPLWDPYSYCGTPIHADLQAQVFYPFTWLAILAGNHTQGRDLYYWVEALVPFHMVLAGVFAFLLLRKLGLGAPAALLGASVYQLGGYFASQAQHLCAICTGAWLPLAVLAAFELRTRFRPAWFSVLALAIAMSILSGFAATAAIVAGSVMLVMAALLLTREARWRALVSIAAAFLAGAAIAAVELVPLWTLTRLSIASERARWYQFGGGLSLKSLISLVSPDHFHIFEFPTLYKEPDNFTFLYVYCGILTVILLALSPFVRHSRTRVFAVLTVVSVFWMLGEHTPVYRNLYIHLPFLLRGSLYAEYAMMAFSFFAALTAAMVLDRFGRRLPQALLWAVALYTSYDLIQTGANRPMNSYRGGYRATDTDYRATGLEVAAKLRAVLERTTPPSRADYMEGGFSPGIYGAGPLGVPTPDGNNPFMLLRMMHLRQQFARGQPWERQYDVNRYGSPLLRLMNVSLLLGPVPIPPDDVKQAGLETLPPVHGYQLYRTPNPLPRFFLTPRVRASTSETETLRLLTAPGFDPAETAIVEGLSQSREGLAAGTVTVNEYAANRVQLTVGAAGPAFLATSEVLYPGWDATVNGHPQTMLMTNGAFRGLLLPAGTSRIVMEYRPRSLAFAMLLSALALIATLGVGLRPVLARAGQAGAATAAASESAAELWRELHAARRRWQAACAGAIVTHRAAIRWIALTVLGVSAFYWKILLTGRFSLLLDPDAVNGSYSWLQFWTYSVRHGVLPLWDPFTLGGQSFCAQLAPAVFYPLHLLLAVAPLTGDGMLSPDLYHLWFVFVHCLAACFLFALAREFRLDRFSSLLAGLCFSLGGFMGGTARFDALESALWLPVVFLFLLHALRAEDARHAVWNAAMSGLALGMSALAGGAGMVAAQATVVISAAIFGARSRGQAALVSAVTVAMGFAAGAVQWLPWLALPAPLTAPAPTSNPYSLLAMVLPGAFHDSLSPYLGTLPLLLAAIAIWKNWRNPWVRYLAGLALAGFLASRVVFPEFSLYLTGFALAVLAGFGTATLLSAAFSPESWSKLDRIVWGTLAISAAAMLFTAIAGRPASPQVELSAVMLLLGYALVRYLGPHSRTAIQAAAIALLLFDLSAFDRLPRPREEAGRSAANPMDRLLQARGAAQFLKWQPGPARVEADAAPPLNIADALGVPTAAGELFNTRYRLKPASTSEPSALYTDAFWRLYENPAAYPRAWMVHQAVFEPTAETQSVRLRSSGFDPHQTAAVDSRVTLQPAPANTRDDITFHKLDGNRLELEVDAKSAGLLVLSEPYAPGWRATVNGGRVPIYRADGSLRALALPRGNNQIVLEYSPWSVYFGGLLTLAAFLGPMLPRVRRFFRAG